MTHIADTGHSNTFFKQQGWGPQIKKRDIQNKPTADHELFTKHQSTNNDYQITTACNSKQMKCYVKISGLKVWQKLEA